MSNQVLEDIVNNMGGKDNVLFLKSEYYTYSNKLLLVFKNIRTGDKESFVINNPKVPVYILKPGKPTAAHYEEYRMEEDLDVHYVSYAFRESEIANILNVGNKFAGQKERMDKITEREDVYFNSDKLIYLNKRVFGSDTDIRTQFLMDYMDMYKEEKDGVIEYTDTPPIENISTGMFDVETDPSVDLKNRNKQPIIVTQYFDVKSKICYVKCLVRDAYIAGGMDKIRADVKGYVERAKSYINDRVEEIDITKSASLLEKLRNGDEGKSSYNHEDNVALRKMIHELLDDVEYDIRFYEDEAEMIVHTWDRIVKIDRPDFLYIYNSIFDINQTVFRAKELKIPLDVLFCDPKVNVKNTYYKHEEVKFDPANIVHKYHFSNLTKIIDMYSSYHSIRAQEKFSSWKLDTVAKRESGFGKVDFSHICQNIWDLAKLDYELYMNYSIIDTLIMACIDVVTTDTTTIMTRRLITRCEYEDMYTPVKFSGNVLQHLAQREGYIMSNQINSILLGISRVKPVMESLKINDPSTFKIIEYMKAQSKIKGGHCSDPNKFIGGTKKFLGKLMNKLTELDVDLDATSMYPSNKRSGNIAKESLYGRLHVSQYEEDNVKAIMAAISKDINAIGSVYFGLPTYDAISDELLNLKTEISCKRRYVKDATMSVTLPGTALNKKLIRALTKLDQTNLNVQDIKTGAQKTKRFFTLADKPVSNNYYGTLLTYYLSISDPKFKPLTEIIGGLHSLMFMETCKDGGSLVIGTKNVGKDIVLTTDDIDLYRDYARSDDRGEVSFDKSYNYDDLLIEEDNALLKSYKLFIPEGVDKRYDGKYASLNDIIIPVVPGVTEKTVSFNSTYLDDTKMGKDLVFMQIHQRIPLTMKDLTSQFKHFEFEDVIDSILEDTAFEINDPIFYINVEQVVATLLVK